MLDLWTEIGCNALRSWGGGVYEDDQFYDICDEKGLCLNRFRHGLRLISSGREYAKTLSRGRGRYQKAAAPSFYLFMGG